MQYIKPALSFEEQADLLIARGLVADKVELISRLSRINYYRFSSYLYPFKMADDQFKPGTTLTTVWRQYTFDRRFRLFVLDALERVEIAVRTQLTYHFTQKYGPFEYFSQKRLINLNKHQFDSWKSDIEREINNSHDYAVKHFKNKYGDTHLLPPLWIACEYMTFGKILTFYRGIEDEIKRKVALEFGIADELFLSWLRTLNEVRNVCAHHGRLWNRSLGNKPYMPRKNKAPEWFSPVKINNDKMFGVLTILRYLLRYAAPTTKWSDRFIAFLDEYPDIPLEWIGFPHNWRDSPLWR